MVHDTALEGVHVLIVDDDQDSRIILEKLLSGSGAVTACAASVEEALSISASRPDVLLTDICMAERDGYDLLRAMRSKFGEDLPAVAVTAFPMTEDKASALQSGFDAHLPKPINASELLAVVSSLAGANG